MAGPIGDEEGKCRIEAPATFPFDRWLNRQLHELYDSIASEPLPDELVALIDSDAGRIRPKSRAPS